MKTVAAVLVPVVADMSPCLEGKCLGCGVCALLRCCRFLEWELGLSGDSWHWQLGTSRAAVQMQCGLPVCDQIPCCTVSRRNAVQALPAKSRAAATPGAQALTLPEGTESEDWSSADEADSVFHEATQLLASSGSGALTSSGERRHSGAHGEGGSANGAEPSWLVLRSIDDSEVEELIEEGNSLDFSDSDVWAPAANSPAAEPLTIELLPRPRLPSDANVLSERAAEAPRRRYATVEPAEFCIASTSSRTAPPPRSAPATDAPPNAPPRFIDAEEAAAMLAGHGMLDRSSRLKHQRAAAAKASDSNVDLAAAVADAVVPVLKVCDAVGVELTLHSPALINHVNKARQLVTSSTDSGGRDADSGATQRGAKLRTSASSENVLRAVSHVLDASMQRLGGKGKVSVSILRGDDAGTVDVVVSDTGVSSAADLDPWLRDREGCAEGAGGMVTPRSAEEAMHRVKAGLPVGTGSMSLRIAERFIQEEEGRLRVEIGGPGALRLDAARDEQWVHTTVTFPAASSA